MIPDLPEGLTRKQAVDFYRQYWGMLSDQSSMHIRWYTHTSAPSRCYICDLSALCSVLLNTLEDEAFLSKSTVDTETISVNESESDSENEINFNYDEEDPVNVPEYDVEEDDLGDVR